MKPVAPFAFLRELATRWDAIAIVLVIGLVAFLGEASHGLLAPLTRLEAAPLSLDPAHLPPLALDIIRSELAVSLALTGANDVRRVSPDILVR